MLLSPEGQTGEAWEPSKNNALWEMGVGGALFRKVLALSFCL
jgi:hypothetical protein